MKTLGLNHTETNAMVRICMAVMLMLAALIPINTYAASTDPSDTAITDTLCRAVNQLTGTIGRSIAIIVVISLAIMLFLGKVSWGLAIATAVGMGILFGAPQVVAILSNGEKACQGS